MNLNINNKDNLMLLNYEKVEDFDKDILIKHQDLFRQLNPEELINIEGNGYIPLDILAYIAEVSDHCKGIVLTIIIDEDAYKYLVDLKIKNKKNKLHLIFKGEAEVGNI